MKRNCIKCNEEIKDGDVRFITAVGSICEKCYFKEEDNQECEECGYINGHSNSCVKCE
jgi:hypothetical protein